MSPYDPTYSLIKSLFTTFASWFADQYELLDLVEGTFNISFTFKYKFLQAKNLFHLFISIIKQIAYYSFFY